MLTPKVFEDDLFDDWMDPFRMMKGFRSLDRKLYGKHADREMLMDVNEKDGNYEVEIDLPGFKKEDINVELNDGYMTVTAAKGVEEEGKDGKGKVIRQERYSGTLSRTFYVGENITNEDVTGKFENGVLKLCIPKREEEKLVNKNRIMIE
ncbi:MAG: Hsp20/alpha crystallin family protein [Erysipelotrichaceae bacterium]|nr:Hsp20/alpha crystallin family protein [Erysipelotrichaceae bacterium]